MEEKKVGKEKEKRERKGSRTMGWDRMMLEGRMGWETGGLENGRFRDWGPSVGQYLGRR